MPPGPTTLRLLFRYFPHPWLCWEQVSSSSGSFARKATISWPRSQPGPPRRSSERARSDVVLPDAPESAHAVAPADLLSFGVSSPVIGDPDLVDAGPRLGDLGRDLWFEPEAILPDHDPLNQLAPEGFVSGFHVREIEVGRHVRTHGQKLVADRMPEIENAMSPGAAEKTGSEDHIGFAGKNRSQEQMIFGRIVFEIGILHDDEGRGGLGNPGAQRCALTLVHLVAEQFDARVELSLPSEPVPGAVLRAVVDDEQFLHRPLVEHDADDFGYRRGLVVDGHDRRQA